MATAWLPVKGWEGRYEVSTNGQIRNSRNGHILTPNESSNGYLTVSLGHKGTHTVHKIVAETFLGSPPPGHQTRHGRAGRHDNHLANLSYGTAKENIRDRDLEGHHYHGNQYKGAKLTAQLVKQIRHKYAHDKTPYPELAAEYKVTTPTIYRVITHKTWKNIA